MRIIPLLMEACSARRAGELFAHSSSRAERALLVTVVVGSGASAAMVGCRRRSVCEDFLGRRTDFQESKAMMVTSYFRLEQYWFMHISYEQIICTKSDEVVYCGNQPGVLSIQLKM